MHTLRCRWTLTQHCIVQYGRWFLLNISAALILPALWRMCWFPWPCELVPIAYNSIAAFLFARCMPILSTFSWWPAFNALLPENGAHFVQYSAFTNACLLQLTQKRPLLARSKRTVSRTSRLYVTHTPVTSFKITSAMVWAN